MDILILIFGIVICSFLSWHWLVSTDSIILNKNIIILKVISLKKVNLEFVFG